MVIMTMTILTTNDIYDMVFWTIKSCSHKCHILANDLKIFFKLIQLIEYNS
jgi:hypothetical protein